MTEYKSQFGYRLIHYWIRNMEKVFLFFIGFIVLMTIYNRLFIDSDLFGKGLQSMLFLLIGGGTIVMGLLSATVVKSQIPQAVAFGSTRIEAFWSNQISSFLMLIQNLFVFIILQVMIEPKTKIFSTSELCICCLFGALMLTSIGIGQLLALLFIHFDIKGVVVFMGIFCSLIGFGIGICAALAEDELSLVFMDNAKIAVASLVIGVITYVIGTILNLGSVKKMTVTL